MHISTSAPVSNPILTSRKNSKRSILALAIGSTLALAVVASFALSGDPKSTPSLASAHQKFAKQNRLPSTPSVTPKVPTSSPTLAAQKISARGSKIVSSTKPIIAMTSPSPVGIVKLTSKPLPTKTNSKKKSLTSTTLPIAVKRSDGTEFIYGFSGPAPKYFNSKIIVNGTGADLVTPANANKANWQVEGVVWETGEVISVANNRSLAQDVLDTGSVLAETFGMTKYEEKLLILPPNFTSSIVAIGPNRTLIVWLRYQGLDVSSPTPPSTPSPTPPSTKSPTIPSETVSSSGADTWSNYLAASGTAGIKIAPYSTVSISCRVQGFKVSDGDTWWYRISNPPWNNEFYVSADAFYNNGLTSGSLVGSPFFDPLIPLC